jgi:hypothetical protein
MTASSWLLAWPEVLKAKAKPSGRGFLPREIKNKITLVVQIIYHIIANGQLPVTCCYL